jgi:hypothetical protein
MEAMAGEKEYLTDAFGREAVAFIQKNKAKPFLLYLPSNAVHGPLEASEKYLKRVEGISLDVVPTVLAAVGRPAKPEDKLDGVDLMPYLSGEKSGRPHDVLYWRFHAKQAIRSGDWKLVKEQRQDRWELYNLADDIGESKNLAEKMPEKVKELEKAWQEWNSQLQAPKWVRQDSRTEGRGVTTQPGQRGLGRGVQERFRQMDRDGDGKLTRDEVGRPALFQRLDQNGDGVVTLDEARKALGAADRPAGAAGD